MLQYLERVGLVLVDEVWEGGGEGQGQLLLVTSCSCLPGFATLLPVTPTTSDSAQTQRYQLLCDIC